MIAPVFVNSAIVRAPERFVLSGGGWSMQPLKVRYGFYDHPRHGPVLFDTGYSARVTAGTERSLALKTYAALVRPELQSNGALDTFLASRGLAARDIATVVITHFHADHVSALHDFPKARFLAPRAAWHALMHTGSIANIRHGLFKELVPANFADRVTYFDTFAVVPLPGDETGHDLFGDRSAVSVDLPGHAPGHSGVWFGAMDEPVLYATDVQWMRRAVTENRIPGFPATQVAVDQTAAISSTRRLQAFAQTSDFLLCHQPEMHRLDCVQD